MSCLPKKGGKKGDMPFIEPKESNFSQSQFNEAHETGIPGAPQGKTVTPTQETAAYYGATGADFEKANGYSWDLIIVMPVDLPEGCKYG